jgi:hypothetical protein
MEDGLLKQMQLLKRAIHESSIKLIRYHLLFWRTKCMERVLTDVPRFE